MKKAEIEIGKTYLCKVSGKVVPVRVVRTGERHGLKKVSTVWFCVNTATNREIVVRSATRFRGPA